MAVHIVIGTRKFMRKLRGHFVFLQSARGLAHSKTLRGFQESSGRAQCLGLIRFPELITGAGSGPGKPLRPRW
jgi:hypothetical protein